MAEAHQAKDQNRAIRLCDEILAKDSAHLPAMELKAKCLWRLGAFEATLALIDSAVALNPFDPGYFYLKGDCLDNLARYPEALTAFERCLNYADARLCAEAEARIREIEERQEELVACLLRCDERFRAEYRKDPVASLLAYGFRFSGREPVRNANRDRHAVIWARPS